MLLDPPVAAAASAAVHSGLISLRRLRSELAGDLGIVERMHFAADDLPGFVPFAGNDQQVARRELGNRRADRLAPVADLDRARRCIEDRATDSRRTLASRIVVGDIDAVGQAGRHLSHQGPLAGVAVATATEQRDQPAGSMRAQGLEHRRQSIRGMGVIDDDRAACC